VSRKGVFIAATMAGLMIVTAVYVTFWLVGQPGSEPTTAPETTPNRTQAAAPKATDASEPAPGSEVIPIKLYVPAGSGRSLATEEQEIQLEDSVQKQVRQVVELLVRRSASFPDGVEVREVFITSQGVAYVDFSPELVQEHPGGTSAEELTVFGLSHTLVVNFPVIKTVKILVEGREIQTIAGHLDLTVPYGRAPDYLRPESERSESRNNETS
jgi:hypothetical protein